MLKKNYLPFFVFLALAKLPVTAQAMASLLTPDGAQAMVKGNGAGRVVRYNYVNSDELLVRPGALLGLPNAAIQQVKANYVQQTLYLAPSSLGLPTLSSLELYNKLLDVKSLLNATQLKNNGKFAPLFKSVQLYSDETFKQQVDSFKMVDVIPEQARYYVRLHDDRLGNLRYTLDITYRQGIMGLTFINLDKANYLVTQVAPVGGIAISLYFSPVNEGVLYVLQIAMQLVNSDEIRKHIDLESFFGRRVEGFKGWLFNHLFNVQVEQGISVIPLVVKKQ
jgi:hypothetical protein